MSKLKLPKLFKRRWLNRSEGSAYLMLHAEVEEGYGRYKDDRSVYAFFEAKDCNRQMKLEFDYHKLQEWEQRKTKIKTLIEALQELEQFIHDNPPVRIPRKKAKRGERETVGELLLTDEYEEGALTTTTEAINDRQESIVDGGTVRLSANKALFVPVKEEDKDNLRRDEPYNEVE